MAGTDPIRECDRFDQNSCPPGQTCDVLVRVFEGTNQLSIYSGCVKTTQERGLGDPCDPDFTGTTPYQTEGLTDLVWRDQCGPGLVCAPDAKIRGGSTCQPNCVSGFIEEDPTPPVACEDPDSFCVPYDIFREACRKSDGCDVVKQTGCRPGFGCYLRVRDDGTGFTSVCFPQPEETTRDGAACQSYNACRPGSSCNGPLRKSLAQWEPMDLVCRPACGGPGMPAGITDDAGQDDGGVADSCSCFPFSQSGLSTSGIPNPPYGQCE